MKQTILFLSFFFFSYNVSFSQTVKGTVVDEEMAVLIGANVFWIDTSIGDATDEMGSFVLNGDAIENKKLVVTYLGYVNDTINITGDADFFIQMKSETAMNEIIVEGKKSGSYISSNDPMKIEVINDVELGKAACCDLAGCFNTNASVEPATTNIITHSKELRILGLSGIYNQLLLDGNPLIQGLSFNYGVSSIPGPFVKNIFISKGTNSVLQGVESISGQINVIIHEPDDAPKLHVNAFLNNFLESQYNIYSGYKLGKSRHFIGAHVVQPATKRDINEDGFLDLPKLSRYEFMDKWVYQNDQENWINTGGIRFTNEKRVGGQKDFDPKTDLGSSSVYGQQIKYNQVDLWNRNTFKLNEKNSMAVILSGQFHQQDAWYGETQYEGKQVLFNSTIQHEYVYKNSSNIRGGISFKYLDLDEDISFSNNPLEKTYDRTYETKEIVPGIFAENTYFSKDNKLTIMLGFKADHLNVFGWKYSPRSLIKYSPKEKTDIRISAGYGWHIPKVFSEQSRILSSQRDIHFHEERLAPDEAWNYGINITQKFDGDNISGAFTVDYYQTRFKNHVQPHYHEFHDAIVFENNDIPAVGNGFQAQITVDLWEWLTLKAAYNFLDIQHTDIEDGEKQSMDFVTKHKFLSAASFAPKGQNWHFDITSQWYGKRSLPETGYYPDGLQQAEESNPYSMLNAQFTYKWKAFEWYAGAENILNFTQRNPIVSAADPFNPYFDTSFAWGPVKGVEGYIGFRYTLKKKDK